MLPYVYPTHKPPLLQASCVDSLAASSRQTAEERRRPSKEGLQAPAQETGLYSCSRIQIEVTDITF